MVEKQVQAVALFIIAVALALYVPTLQSDVLHLGAAPSNVQTLFQIGFIVLGLGYLLKVAIGGAER